MIEKMPHGVSLYGRLVLRSGKFDKYFNVAIPAGVSAEDLKKCFADAGVNMAILLRLFDKSQKEREVFMLWKHCATCNQDFETVSDVCPNHTGHNLTLIMPQPFEEVAPTVVKPSVEEEVKAPVEEMPQAPADPPADLTGMVKGEDFGFAPFGIEEGEEEIKDKE